MSDVTRILSEINTGDQQASADLLPLVYDELRKLAASRMANERVDHTLQATALVHETYLRLLMKPGRKWDSRGHFFAAAAEAMRRILVEYARRKECVKRGGAQSRQSLGDDFEIALPMPSEQLLSLHDALEILEANDPQSAQLVKLRFFAGFSMAEVADLVGRPLRSIEREWTYARTWLHRELRPSG